MSIRKFKVGDLVLRAAFGYQFGIITSCDNGGHYPYVVTFIGGFRALEDIDVHTFTELDIKNMVHAVNLFKKAHKL